MAAKLKNDGTKKGINQRDQLKPKDSKSLQKIFGLFCYFYSVWVMTQLLIWLGNYFSFLPFSLATVFPYPNIDGSSSENNLSAVLINLDLLIVFGITHLVMARKWFKEFAIRNLYSKSVERSVYLLVSCLIFHLIFKMWRPIPQTIFQAPTSLSDILFWGPLIGNLISLISTFNLDHYELFGLNQTFQLSSKPTEFQVRGFYRYVRHPMMFGLFISLWMVPVMTVGRFLFASFCSVYVIYVVLNFEEPDLKKDLGKPYSDYCRSVPAFFPNGKGYQSKGIQKMK